MDKHDVISGLLLSQLHKTVRSKQVGQIKLQLFSKTNNLNLHDVSLGKTHTYLEKGFNCSHFVFI